MKFFKFFIFLVLFVVTLRAGDNFNLVDTWRPGDEIMGRYAFAIINDDGNIIATFYMSGNRVITPKKIIKFAPQGQGPGDLTDMQALLHYKKDIAFVERPEKVKVFTKDGETYKIKEILWLKRGKWIHIIKDGLYLDNKWFLAGFEVLDFDKEKKIEYFSQLKIYDDKGKPVTSLIKSELHKPGRLYELDKYLVNYKDKVYFLAENELKVRVISIKELKEEKAVDLEIPKFYKRMPEDFYGWKKYNGLSDKNLTKDIEYWKTSYSRINKVIIEGDFLVLQIRTCSEDKKTFALLFYNAANFKLEKTIFTDDLLLCSRKGKYYCFAGGDPGLDEGAADEFKINVYRFGGKSEKK